MATKPAHTYTVRQTVTARSTTEGTTAFQVDTKLDGGYLVGFKYHRTGGSATGLDVTYYHSAVAGNAGHALGSFLFSATSDPIYPAADGDAQIVLFDQPIAFQGSDLYVNLFGVGNTASGVLETFIIPDNRVRVTTGTAL